MSEEETSIIAKCLAEATEYERRLAVKELVAARQNGNLVNGAVRILTARVALRADIPTHIAKAQVIEHLLYQVATEWLDDDAPEKPTSRRGRRPANAATAVQ